ncbi:MAG: cation:proton antiporter [Kiritimatiellia bacterium]|jgi:Kef-type K+ transport system membrane component KefB/mannitol/fructose-specific phosphotransferase system IIA component (Ntr-type)|nr:cation:proton antiporter [Kiritimatiellia bacterium]
MVTRGIRRAAALAVAAMPVSVWAGGGDAPASATDAAARFILQLGVLVFAAKLGGILFERGRLPMVLGEVAAGMVVGPYLLGGVALPFFPRGLMGDAEAFLSVWGGGGQGLMAVTLAVFFFLAGLDTDLRQMRRLSAGGVLAGVCGFLFAFGAGFALLVRAAPALLGPAQPWHTSALLLCAVPVSVTSVGFLARLLAARKRLESPVGTLALTAAMAGNVLGLIVFTVVAGVSGAGGGTGGLSAARVAAVAWRAAIGLGTVLLLGIPLARRMNALAVRERNYGQPFAVSAAGLLIAGGVIGACGLPVVSGAYMMGVAFSAMDVRHEIRERLDFVSLTLMPACFASLGMRLNPNLLANETVLGTSVLLAAAVLAANLAGGAAGASLARLGVAASLRAGILTLPRAELSLALLAAVGGLIALPQGLLFCAVFLILSSCVALPFLSDRVWGRDGCGGAGGGSGPEPARLAFRFSSRQAAQLMANRVVELFEDEGFYAQVLNRHHMLYRISRETQVIHLQSRDGEIAFECGERERALVNTVMLEALSDIEGSLRALRRPLDDVLLRKNMQAPEAAAAGTAGVLRNRLFPETCRPRLLASTPAGAVAELVNLLCESGLVTDRDRALQAVLDREQNLSTGLEHGVALPHARTDAVTRLVCAVGLKKEGLAYDTLDGRPARIVALVLAPEQAAAPQLQVIAHLCRLLDGRGRAALLACETPDDMYAALTGGRAGAAAGARQTILARCLRWQSVALDFDAEDRQQGLALLLALCARSGAVNALPEALADIRRCAETPPVWIGGEVAVFPVRTGHVDRMVAAVGIAPAARAPGGGPRVWVMVLYPESEAVAYAEAEAELRQHLTGRTLDGLLAAKTGHEAFALLAGG